MLIRTKKDCRKYLAVNPWLITGHHNRVVISEPLSIKLDHKNVTMPTDFLTADSLEELQVLLYKRIDELIKAYKQSEGK